MFVIFWLVVPGKLVENYKRAQTNHFILQVTRNVGENLSISYIEKCDWLSPILCLISDAINQIEPNTPLNLKPLLPDDHRKCCKWTQTLKQGLQLPVVHVQYSPGATLETCGSVQLQILMMLWKAANRSLKSWRSIFHNSTPEPWEEMLLSYLQLVWSLNKSVVRCLYKEFVCDSSVFNQFCLKKKLIGMFKHVWFGGCLICIWSGDSLWRKNLIWSVLGLCKRVYLGGRWHSFWWQATFYSCPHC